MRSFGGQFSVSTGARAGDLRALAAAIEAIETDARRGDSRSGRPGPAGISTGWDRIDAALGSGGGGGPGGGGGLALGVVHEWFGLGSGDAASENRNRSPTSDLWLPPLNVLMHLAHRAAMQRAGQVVWIGDRCRPYPPAMPCELLARSVFVSCETCDERVWAIDLALRCAGVCAVIADGSGLRMAESRRCQLAAAAGAGEKGNGGGGGGGVLALLARPPWELVQLSASRTRWRVSPAPHEERGPGWSIELLRCKGVPPTSEGSRRWVVRHDHATGDVHLVAESPAGRDATLGTAQRRIA